MSSVSALDKLKADLEAKRKLRAEAGAKPPPGGSGIQPQSQGGSQGGAPPDDLTTSGSLRRGSNAPPPVPARHAPPAPARHAPLPPASTPTTNVQPPTPEPVPQDEFAIMMQDLGFPETQKQQMLLLPASHKQTLVQQWKKKKEEQTKSADGGSGRGPSSSISTPSPTPISAPAPTPTPTAAPTASPSLSAQEFADKKAALDKLREDLARKKTSVRVSSKYGLKPDDPVAEAIAQTVEKRKQEKLEALNQLKEKLAEKRKNINVQTAGSAGATGEKPAGGNVNEEALQHLMASLEEKRQKRREERQKKKVQRRASRAASIRIISAIAGDPVPARVPDINEGQPDHKPANARGQSLAQLQNAIKSVDENKKLRAAANQDSKEARAKRRAELISGLPADLVPLTPEEKAIQRESRRVKRESKKLDMVTKEFAIDNQLSGFLQTLTKLEEEFKRQATERIEKQMQFDLMEKENQRMQNKINTVEEVLEHTKEKMNKLSSTIDRCIGRNPNDIDLRQTQVDLNDIRKELGMEEIFNTERDEKEREAEKAEAEAAAEKAKEEAESAPVSGLLAAIRGANLKKTANNPPPPPAPAKSGDLLTSLQDTLRDALNVRKVAIMDSDSESDSDSDDDEDWLDEELEEYEDLLDMMNTPVNV